MGNIQIPSTNNTSTKLSKLFIPHRNWLEIRWKRGTGCMIKSVKLLIKLGKLIL